MTATADIIIKKIANAVLIPSGGAPVYAVCPGGKEIFRRPGWFNPPAPAQFWK